MLLFCFIGQLCISICIDIKRRMSSSGDIAPYRRDRIFFRECALLLSAISSTAFQNQETLSMFKVVTRLTLRQTSPVEQNERGNAYSSFIKQLQLILSDNFLFICRSNLLIRGLNRLFFHFE